MNIIDDIINAVEKVDWSFESHDPFWAWFIVGMYLLAAFLCLRALFCSQRSLLPDIVKKKSRLFWAFLFIIMLFLACNKQLDIQTYITAVGREVAHAQGWYEQRRTIQKEVVITLILIAFLFLIYMFYMVYNLPTANKIAMIGALFTFSFIGMRALSFHHVDHYVGRVIFGVKMHILIEICGGVIVSLGALLSVVTLSKWELIYDDKLNLISRGSVINHDFDLDSDFDSDSSYEIMDVVNMNDDTKLDIRAESSCANNKFNGNSGMHSDRNDMTSCAIDSGSTNEVVAKAVPFCKLVSGTTEKDKSDDSKVELFQKVSNPKYGDNKKVAVDNASPRISRERLSEVNRIRREFKVAAEFASDARGVKEIRRINRDDSWITRTDETGWI